MPGMDGMAVLEEMKGNSRTSASSDIESSTYIGARAFAPWIKLIPSKTKPKKLGLVSDDGLFFCFLCSCFSM